MQENLFEIPREALDDYRARTYHLPPASRIQTPDQALECGNGGCRIMG